VFHVVGLLVWYCGHEGPNTVALMMCPLARPFGSAGSQRLAPFGGSAYGIPRNWTTFGVTLSIVPRKTPEEVSMTSELNACAHGKARKMKDLMTSAWSWAGVDLIERLGLRLLPLRCAFEDRTGTRIDLKQGIAWVCVTLHYRDISLAISDLSHRVERPKRMGTTSDCIKDENVRLLNIIEGLLSGVGLQASLK
jgi:hypothetical protein